MPLNVVAKLAITAAMTAANMALQMTRRIEGPRLEDLDVTLADYGTPIPRFWGKRRFEGVPVIWAERLREVKQENKTKGGKYDEYKYYGTWAVLICDHEIEAVSRIWMDKHLVYDASNYGPISAFFGIVDGESAPVKISRGRNMRIYLGTEDQTADPRMESWCEDRYGADSCPAYKGVSYIVFENLPLEKFGNRIPQISVEAINTSTNNYPYEVKDAAYGDNYLTFSPDFTRFLTATEGADAYEIWDVPTRTVIVSGTWPVNTSGSFAIGIDGSIYGSGITVFPAKKAYIFSADGHGYTESLNTFPQTIASIYYVGGAPWWSALTGHTYAQTLAGGTITAYDVGFTVSHYFEDNEGRPIAVGRSGTTIYFHNLGIGPSFHITSPTASTSEIWCVCNSDGKYFCYQNGDVFIVDPATATVTATGSATAGVEEGAFKEHDGSDLIWLQEEEWNTLTCTKVRTVNYDDWFLTAAAGYYDPINHALLGYFPGITGQLNWLYLDRVASPGMTLEEVVTDVAGWCGLDSIDASDLTQTVDGYSVTQGTGKDMISPLLDLHDSIARPHDFSVQFLQLGDASQGTLLTEDFVRAEDRYTVTIAQDTDIPRRLTVNFADLDKEQQNNTVISQRPLDSVDSNRELTIDLTTYAMSVGDAQKLSDRFFRRQWNGRENVSLGLAAQNLGIEPGDVYTLDLDGVSRTARLEKMTLSQGAIQTEWKRDFAGLHTLGTGAGAEMEGRDDDVIFIPSPSKGMVLDIPLIEDADSTGNVVVYYGAGSYGSGGWPGAAIYEETTGSLAQWNSVESWNNAAWGYATEALPTANFCVWDRGNSVNIRLNGGSLTSCTEADIDADPSLNLAYLGGELINFTTATLQADGTYDISGFKRGRRGTEGYRSTHAAGELFALLSTFKTDEYGLSDVGTEHTFRATTLGRDVSLAYPFDFEVEGNSLKPYAPARLKVYYDGTDLACTITRRTRLGGAWVGGTTIPLSENSQEYEVDVYNGATLKRTITVSGTNTFTYTAAFAAADGITLPTAPTFKVYQMSDVVGRGYELAA